MKKILLLLLSLACAYMVHANPDDITVARRMKMLITDFESDFPEPSILSGKTLADELDRIATANQEVLDKVFVVSRNSAKNLDLSGFQSDDITGVMQKGALFNVESILTGKVTLQSNGKYELQVQLIDIQKKNIPTTRRVLNFATAKDVENDALSVVSNLNNMVRTLAAGNFPRVDIITPNFDVVSIIQINKDNFPEMKLNVNVVNNAGEPVSLPPELFEIRENGNMVMASVQKVKSTDLKTAPMTILLVIDRSPSMLEELNGKQTGQPFARAKAAAIEFIGKMAPYDRVKIVAFDYDSLELGDYTTNKRSYISKLNSLQVGRGTGLYNILQYAVKDLSNEKGDKAIILLTDGKNDVRGARAELQKITFEDALTSIKEYPVPIYSIGFGGVDDKVMNEVAILTHGIYFKASSSEKLRELYLKLHNIIENQYIITYKSLADRTGRVSVDLNIKKDERGFDLTPEEQKKGEVFRQTAATKAETEIIQLQKKEIASAQAEMEQKKIEIENQKNELLQRVQSLDSKEKEYATRLSDLEKMKSELELKNQNLEKTEKSLQERKKAIEAKEKTLSLQMENIQKQKETITEIQNNIKKANTEIIDFLKTKFEYIDKEKERLDSLSGQTKVTQ